MFSFYKRTLKEEKNIKSNPQYEFRCIKQYPNSSTPSSPFTTTNNLHSRSKSKRRKKQKQPKTVQNLKKNILSCNVTEFSGQKFQLQIEQYESNQIEFTIRLINKRFNYVLPIDMKNVRKIINENEREFMDMNSEKLLKLMKIVFFNNKVKKKSDRDMGKYITYEWLCGNDDESEGERKLNEHYTIVLKLFISSSIPWIYNERILSFKFFSLPKIEIFQLCNDLIIEIFEYMEPKDLFLSIALVNKSLNEMTNFDHNYKVLVYRKYKKDDIKSIIEKSGIEVNEVCWKQFYFHGLGTLSLSWSILEKFEYRKKIIWCDSTKKFLYYDNDGCDNPHNAQLMPMMEILNDRNYVWKLRLNKFTPSSCGNNIYIGLFFSKSHGKFKVPKSRDDADSFGHIGTSRDSFAMCLKTGFTFHGEDLEDIFQYVCPQEVPRAEPNMNSYYDYFEDNNDVWETAYHIHSTMSSSICFKDGDEFLVRFDGGITFGKNGKFYKEAFKNVVTKKNSWKYVSLVVSGEGDHQIQLIEFEEEKRS